MRVVQLNCVYGNGSTGKIVEAIHRYLQSEGDESYVLYGYGPSSCEPHAIRVVPPAIRKAQSLRSRITGYPYGGAIWGTVSTISLLNKIKPDVVHIHCYNAYIANIYSILTYLKRRHIPTVITNHAEFMYTGGCTHSLQCSKWLIGCGGCDKIGKEHPISWFFDRTHSEWERLCKAYGDFSDLTICCVSDWVRNRAAQSPFFQGHRVLTILNGLDTSIFKYRFNDGLRNKLSSNERQKVVLHVTPDFSDPIKGGQYVLEIARRMPDVSFVVVGNQGGVSTDLNNVFFAGRADDQIALAEYYSAADVCLLTSKVETYSMVTAESLCCGTPVVGFRAGGPETIAIPEYSAFVPQQNDIALENQLLQFATAHYCKEDISAIARNKYCDVRMCSNYRQIYLESCNGC